MSRNFFITGPPSAGKTTIILKILSLLNQPANGFYTQEERVEGRRVGFMMHTLDGRQGYLAHQDIQSEYAIRRYGVSIENIESIAIPSIEPHASDVIILDEIGKMECFSPLFCEAAERALNAPNTLIGTITLGGTGFIETVQKREDITIIEATLENRDNLPEHIMSLI